MKKNVIRLTEAELKQYISKVVAEQTAIPAVVNIDVEQEKMNGLRSLVVGKNVQLYLDMAKTKKSHMVKIKSAGFSSKVPGVYYFPTTDLAFVTSTGGQAEPQDDMDPIENLRFDCKEPDELFAMGSGGKAMGQVFCPPFSELVNKSVACTTINRNPDFAAAKPVAPAAVAPKADLA